MPVDEPSPILDKRAFALSIVLQLLATVAFAYGIVMVQEEERRPLGIALLVGGIAVMLLCIGWRRRLYRTWDSGPQNTESDAET